MATAPDYVPQFVSPFTIGPDGQPVTCEQGSSADIGSQVMNVLECPLGAKVADPTFGIPWPVFQLVNVDVQAVTDAIQALVPDATVEIVQQAVVQVTHPQQVTLQVTATVPDATD